MVSETLMQEVMSLPLEDRRELFFALLHDPELKIDPFDAINVRQNREQSLALQQIIETE